LLPDQLRGHKGYGQLDYMRDICAIPVADASFDLILCREVLEHVPEPIRAVKEFARIVKPEGKLLLAAPLGSGLHQEPYHFYGGYMPHWYLRFLHEAGFDDIQIEPNSGFYRLYGQESMRCALLLRPWRGAADGSGAGLVSRNALVPVCALAGPFLGPNGP
jgi:SAM-dependent methyltransferase